MIYLDHAAATPLDPSVLSAMTPFMTDMFHNPSSLYLAGRATRQALETARHDIAKILGAKSSEIVFTSGGTEANNLAIHGVMRQNPRGNIIVSSIEHESVLGPAEKYEKRIVPVGPDGRIDLHQLAARIDADTALVSVMYANNEIGTIQPMKDIADFIRQKEKAFNTRIIFHADAAQAGSYLDLHVDRLGVDLMTLNGGKLYGPRAVGCLYVRSPIMLEPLLEGGGQESGTRSGTENVAGAIGLAMALTDAQSRKNDEVNRLSAICEQFIEKLQNISPDIIVNSPFRHCLPNTINITFPGIDGEALVMALDQHGVQVATGSACHASSDLPSHVLLAIGRSESEATSSIRLTMGRATTGEQMDEVATMLPKIVDELQKSGYVVG